MAEGWSTNAVPVAINAKGGIPVIFTGIQAGQRLFQIKKHYLTANRYIRILEIRFLKQDVYESIFLSKNSKVWRPIRLYWYIEKNLFLIRG